MLTTYTFKSCSWRRILEFYRDICCRHSDVFSWDFCGRSSSEMPDLILHDLLQFGFIYTVGWKCTMHHKEENQTMMAAGSQGAEILFSAKMNTDFPLRKLSNISENGIHIFPHKYYNLLLFFYISIYFSVSQTYIVLFTWVILLKLFGKYLFMWVIFFCIHIRMIFSVSRIWFSHFQD